MSSVQFATPPKEALFAPGLRVEIRDAEWVIKRADLTSSCSHTLLVIGISEIVRGKEARFLTEIDQIKPLHQEYRAQLNERGKKELGDAHQRIYHHRVSLGKCGIDIRGRGKKLKINYRTTDEIRRFAVHLLEGRPIDDLDGGSDDQKGYMSLTHGTAPFVKAFPSAAEEAAYLKQHIQALVAEGSPLESICVVVRTKKLVENYGAHLRSADIETYEIKRDTAEQRDRAGVRVATMHRVKGLEFEHVIIAGANRGVIPLDMVLASGDDAITQRNLETGERSLLYVALTRARRSATITGYGQMSPFLTRGRS
jgi:superfamily I DNA/RNA helicase